MAGIGDFVQALGAFTEKNIGAIGFGAGIASSASQVAGGFLGRRQGRINAKILERQGQQAFAARLAQAVQEAGTARAVAAKGGGDPNRGSPADVSRQIEAEGRVAALREKFAFQNEAAFAERRGMNALFRGILGGSSTLLGAANRFDQVDDNDDLRVPDVAPDSDGFLSAGVGPDF